MSKRKSDANESAEPPTKAAATENGGSAKSSTIEQTLLLKFVGSFAAKMSTFEGGGMTCDARSENKLVYNKFVQQHYSQDFNGMPYEGVGTVGFDGGRKVLQSSWLDNMSDAQFFEEGVYQKINGHDGFALKGLHQKQDWKTGKLKRVRSTYEFRSDTEIYYSSFQQYEGEEETLAMTILYTKS